MNSKIEGLTSRQVEESLSLHGDNALQKEKSKGFFKRFWENLSDPIIKILLIALGLQILFTFRDLNYFETFGILSAIFLSTMVSTVSEYRSEKAFEKLDTNGGCGSLSVMRDGEIKAIPIENIVVGDIVYLSAGEIVAADGTVISGRVTVDQSALNGESVEVVKAPGEDYGWDLGSASKVFRGSVITEGSAVIFYVDTEICSCEDVYLMTFLWIDQVMHQLNVEETACNL